MYLLIVAKQKSTLGTNVFQKTTKSHFVTFLFLTDKINNNNQITPENVSAATEIHKLRVKNVAARINKPIVVNAAVNPFRIVFPFNTSFNCGIKIKPNSKLTAAITISCHNIMQPGNKEVK
jgi:hypothetical protein